LQYLIMGCVIMVMVKCIVSLLALCMKKAAAKVSVEDPSPEGDNVFLRRCKIRLED